MFFIPLLLLCMSEITSVKGTSRRPRTGDGPWRRNSPISHIFKRFCLFRGWWSPLQLLWCTDLTFVGQSVVICLPGKQLFVICVLKSSIQDGPSQRQWYVECIELYQDHQCWGGFFWSSCVCDHSSNSLEWLGEASKIHLVLFTQVEIILERVEEGLQSVISDLWGEPCLVPLYLCLWHT